MPRTTLISCCKTLLAALLVLAQLLLPPVARAQLPGMGDGGEMTISAERQLGDRIGRELYRDNAYIDDPVLQEYVQSIFQKLMAAARTRGELSPEMEERFAWRVVLMRDRDINAFALPGGYMGINLGLIAVVGSRDELATVMGHELSHITQRHIARMLDKQSRQTPWMLAGMILGAIAASRSGGRSGGDLGQAMIMGTQAYAMNSQLSFSRDMEREADRVGFGVMTQAGYAPQGAAAMFEKLQYASRLNDNGSYPYLRSHPLTSERIADMQARSQLGAGNHAALPLVMDHAMISARARVLARGGVDQLRLWVDAAGSTDFDKGSPAQQAGTLYAASLSAAQLRDFEQARALAARLVTRTNGDASASRLARLLSAEVELIAGTPARATPWIDTKAKERPEQFQAAQWAVATRQTPAQQAPVVQGLRDRVARDPRDAGAWRLLSNLYNAQNEPLRALRAEAESNVAMLDYPAARDRFKAAQDLARQMAEGKPGLPPLDHYEASIIDSREREIEGLIRQQMQDERGQPR
ncbi:M48 family metalloprotease [Variovorax sp. OV329]|uniref:M48 family metalloprotease n=1 Tax=Variovorax sp. OV329 TaxID=1882825 RepID=UPI00158723A0|nr:M48 family metalloprotease [Variovorax sp. OV329]